jgi:hypothetical protein
LSDNELGSHSWKCRMARVMLCALRDAKIHPFDDERVNLADEDPRLEVISDKFHFMVPLAKCFGDVTDHREAAIRMNKPLPTVRYWRNLMETTRCRSWKTSTSRNLRARKNDGHCTSRGFVFGCTGTFGKTRLLPKPSLRTQMTRRGFLLTRAATLTTGH